MLNLTVSVARYTGYLGYPALTHEAAKRCAVARYTG
jgi:hypothetical protein